MPTTLDLGKNTPASGSQSQTVACTTTQASNGKVVVFVGWFGASVTLSSVDDNSGLGRTWTVDVQGATGSDHFAIASCDGSIPSGTVITAHFSASTADSRYIAAASTDGANANASVVAVSTPATGSGTSWNGGAATAGNGDVMFGGCYGAGNNATDTATGGTEIHEMSISADSAMTSQWKWSAGASETAAGTWSTTETWVGATAIYDGNSINKTPSVAGVAESASPTTAATSHTVTYPSNIAAGDLLIMIADKGSTAATVDAITGWTELLDENSANGLYAAWKKADGTETGTFTVTSSASTRMAFILYRITGAADPNTIPPEIGTTGTGTSATPDPPSSATISTTKDYLFIAFAGMAGEEADDDTWGNTPPTNYTPSPPRQKTCGTVGTNLGGLILSAERVLNTNTAENPGTFGVDVSAAWRSNTITVHPELRTFVTLTPATETDAAQTANIDEAYALGRSYPRPAGSATTSSGASLAVTVTEDIPVGKTAFAVVHIGSASGPPLAGQVTDSKGNTWTLDEVIQNAGAMSIGVYSSQITTALVGATDTVTLTPSATAQLRIAVCSMVGLLAASPKDTSATNQADAAASATVGPTGTLASDREFILHVMSCATGDGTQAKPDSSYTPIFEGVGGLANSNMNASWKNVAATTAISGTYSWSGATRNYSELVVAYKVTMADGVGTAQPLDIDKKLSVAPASETDAAQVLSFGFGGSGHNLTAATETDAAVTQDVDKKATLTAASETDAAQAQNVDKKLSIAAAAEIDSAVAQNVDKKVTLAPASETDTSTGVSIRIRKTLTAATETDLAQALVKVKRAILGPASEIDSAQPANVDKKLSIVPASETDTAQPLDKDKRRTIVPASEADSVIALNVDKKAFLIVASETDVAQVLSFSGPQHVQLVPAAETDTAIALTFTKPIHKILAPATETDSAQTAFRSKRVTIVPASETDLARILTQAQHKALTAATETDTAVGVSLRIRVTLVPAAEVDEALTLVIVGGYEQLEWNQSTGADWLETIGNDWPQSAGSNWP